LLQRQVCNHPADRRKRNDRKDSIPAETVPDLSEFAVSSQPAHIM
jgi:hypothetical protein